MRHDHDKYMAIAKAAPNKWLRINMRGGGWTQEWYQSHGFDYRERKSSDGTKVEIRWTAGQMALPLKTNTPSPSLVNLGTGIAGVTLTVDPKRFDMANLPTLVAAIQKLGSL